MKEEIMSTKKIINAFNAGDSLRKFTELVIKNGLLSESEAKIVYNKLTTQFNELGANIFLEKAATKRQAELLIANGEIWTHRNMFNTLNALKEQKELDDSFRWIEQEVSQI